MALNAEVARKIEEIRNDRTHGASWLSRQALEVINLSIGRSEASSVITFLEDLKGTGKELAESKPSMASITNMIARLVYRISRESEVEKDLVSLKRLASFVSDELIRSSEQAFRTTTVKGAGVVEKGDRLMTCSYSSTICQALRIAALRGKDFHLIVAESVFDGKSYGEVAASELKSYGIEADIILDSAIKERMPEVNKVLVGADSLLYDGSLVNGKPTNELARAAKECHVPFYTLCETAKFDARSFLGRSVRLDDGFENVPPHLITGIITEEGIMKPEGISTYIEELAIYVRTLFVK